MSEVGLEGKVVLVTGASRGIGRRICARFLAAGARVAAVARTGGDLESLLGDAPPGSAAALPLDITDENSCAAAVRECERELGPPDVLVNNAGIAVSASFSRTGTELWRRTMAINVDAPFWLTRAALPAMLERRSGAVIAIASIAARRGFPYTAAYTTSKHAVLGMTRALAAEHAASGVTFNCVCPHYVDTPMTEATVQNIVERTGRDRAAALAPLLTPQGRLVDADEVASLVLYLASPSGRGISGQAINLDGGELQS